MVVDIMYECADICEHEFDVEVELGMSGLRVNYTMSNASSVIVWKVIAVITWPENILCHISRCTDITTGMLTG